MLQRSLVIIPILFALAAAAQAAEGGATSQPAPANPLAGLPGRPGPQIGKIKALGDNQWLALPPVAGDPKWGVARGRSWGGRSLTYAPDLAGAFFCGEGVHSYVKPDGYYMNDLWFYDANANRWICLNPGTHVKTAKLHLDAHGFEVDEQGRQNPLGFLGHAYGSTTYDRDLRKYVAIYTNICYLNTVFKGRQEWLGVPEEKRGNLYACGQLNASAKHPLFWDVAAGRWERRFVEAPGGFDGSREDGLAQYVPAMKKTMFAIRDQVWFYDHQTNAWTGSAKVACPLKGYGNGCLDPKRGRVYAAAGKQIAYYDLKAAAWTELKATSQPDEFLSTNTVCLNYDTANDVLLYTRNNFRSKPSRPPTQAAYLPDENKWAALPEASFPQADLPKQAAAGLGSMGLHSYYDEQLNAHFFFLANDSSDVGAMVVYRYRNPKE